MGNPEPVDALPSENSTEVEQQDTKKETFLQVIHGEIIQDRKSVFQGHLAQVHSVEETK